VGLFFDLAFTEAPLPTLLVVLGSTLLATTPGPLLWRFLPAQEFYIEEYHRQLLTVTPPAVTTYLDYSILIKYRVTTLRRTSVTLEATVEGIRINNVNEAGARAVEDIKKWDKSKATWRLTRTQDGWTAEPGSANPKLKPPYMLVLGTEAVSSDRSWRQSWAADTAGAAQPTVTMEGRVKGVDPARVRVELRATWAPPTDSSGVRVTSQPADTPGLAFFDRTNGRWEQVDFRLKGTFHAHAGGQPYEVKQDLTTLYRFFDRVPWWWSSTPSTR
jgi:hypothetical protein